MFNSTKHFLGCAFCLLMMQSLSFSSFGDAQIHAVALFKNKAVLDIDGKRRSIKVGATTREGITLVSANSDKAVIEVQGEKITLELNGKITAGSPKHRNVVQIYPGEGGHYFVEGLLNGNKMPFLVDTGATTIAINKNMAKRMGLQYRVDGIKSRVETASGTTSAYSVRFETVQIRSITLKNVKGTVLDGDYPSIALLGQSFLNKLNLRRDGIVMELSER